MFTGHLTVCLWCLGGFYFWLHDSVHVWFVPVCVYMRLCANKRVTMQKTLWPLSAKQYSDKQ